MRVHAEREVGAPPNAVFAFLADLENHWGLAADWVQVRALHRADGDESQRVVTEMREKKGGKDQA